MDLVRELKEVRFELALRGYECETVDAFLARLRGEVSAVQQENNDAKEKIAQLESQVKEGGGSSETEGTLRRTLVLAQRLADETEVDAKRAAAELVDAATAESNELKAAAEADAASMRETAEADLKTARDEADELRASTNEEAAKARADARQQVELILDQAEQTGAERVVAIEEAAQQEAATMRGPIRAEVTELEEVRSRLLGDISALEEHLEAQRVRVRTAVDALRVGMSGSIEDLERVAEDDALLATEAAPAQSGARASDVHIAPDVEIVDRVAESVSDAPTVDDVEIAALEGYEPVVDASAADVAETMEVDAAEDVSLVGSSLDEATVVPDTVVPDTAVGDTVMPDAVVPAPVVPDPVASAPIVPVDSVAITDESVEAMPVDDGPHTEPMPVIATEVEVDESELVVLDDEPSGMFGTEIGEDADASPLGTSAVAVGGAGVAAAAAGTAGFVSSEDDNASVDEPVSEPSVSFVARFGAALDEVPIARN